MTDLNEMMTEAENFADPTKFQEMLDKACGVEPEEEEEETAAEEEETAAEEEPANEEPKEFHIPKYRFDQSQTELREYKRKYEELYGVVEDMVKGKESPAEEEFDPIDEVAHKKYMEKLEKLEKAQNETRAQAENQALANAIVAGEQAAKQKYSDYDLAFAHYTQVKVQEVMALGYSEEEAVQSVKHGVLNTAVGAVKNQRDVGDVFYNLAMAAGYKSATASPKVDKLAENRAKTERRPSERAASDTSNADVVAQFKAMAKKGSYSNDDFKKLLARARGEK